MVNVVASSFKMSNATYIHHVLLQVQLKTQSFYLDQVSNLLSGPQGLCF